MEKLVIAGREFNSRLFLGTGKFNSNEIMEQSILASGTEMVTVAMKRIELENKEDDMLKHIRHPHIQLLPNTSGVRNAEEAVFAAQMAREAFGTNWLKNWKFILIRAIFSPDSTEYPGSYGRTGEAGVCSPSLLPGGPHTLQTAGKKPALLPSCRWAHLSVRIKDCRPETFCGLSSNRPAIPVVVDAGIGAPQATLPKQWKTVLSCLSGKYGHCRSRKPHSYGTSLQTSRRSRTVLPAYEAGLGLEADSFVAEASSPLTAFLNE